MDQKTDLIELLRQIVREQPELAQSGIHIHIHGHIIFGSDIGSVTALKLLLRAHDSSQIAPLPKAKLAP